MRGKDLVYALSRPDIFEFADIKVVKNATTLDAECTARPCYTAALNMKVPTRGGGMLTVKATITQNMRFEVEHELSEDQVAPCLFQGN